MNSKYFLVVFLFIILSFLIYGLILLFQYILSNNKDPKTDTTTTIKIEPKTNTGGSSTSVTNSGTNESSSTTTIIRK